MNIDGVWTSGDVLMRLIESKEALQPLSRDLRFHQRREQITAEMELIATRLSDGLEIVDRLYVAVLPKRDFRIHIERGGWTGPEAAKRVVTADIIRGEWTYPQKEAK